MALAGVAVLARCLVPIKRPSFRLPRARMDAASERVRELLDKEAQKARLLRLDVVAPNANAPEVALSCGDDAATWADGLFARCAGNDARLYYDGTRGHWSACVPLFDGGPTVAFAVDERDRRRPFDALLEALEIVAADAPPVIDLAHPADAVCVRFDDSVGRWQAYQHCDACGGGWLNTMLDDRDHAPLARLTARGLLAHDEHQAHDDHACSMRCLQCAMR